MKASSDNFWMIGGKLFLYFLDQCISEHVLNLIIGVGFDGYMNDIVELEERKFLNYFDFL